MKTRNFLHVKELLWITCIWWALLAATAIIIQLQDVERSFLFVIQTLFTIALILANQTFFTVLVLSIERRLNIISHLNYDLAMLNDFDPTQWSVLLLKANMIILPVAFVQLIFPLDVFEGVVQQFAYLLLAIELLLTGLLYLWTRIELANKIKEALSEEDIPTNQLH